MDHYEKAAQESEEADMHLKRVVEELSRSKAERHVRMACRSVDRAVYGLCRQLEEGSGYSK